MKKIAIGLAFLIFLPIPHHAMTIGLGVGYGIRTVVDSQINDIYGKGTVYNPFLELKLLKGLFFGAGYEGGYRRDGKIGMYREATTLEVKGIDVFLGYEFKIKAFAIFVRGGAGYYLYKQTIDSPYVQDYKVNHKEIALNGGGGLRIYPVKFFYIGGEVKYVWLKVKPFEDQVDLSGLRYLGSLGFSFSF